MSTCKRCGARRLVLLFHRCRPLPPPRPDSRFAVHVRDTVLPPRFGTMPAGVRVVDRYDRRARPAPTGECDRVAPCARFDNVLNFGASPESSPLSSVSDFLNWAGSSAADTTWTGGGGESGGGGASASWDSSSDSGTCSGDSSSTFDSGSALDSGSSGSSGDW